MKTKLAVLALLLATGGSLFAQNPTAVTGTITDANTTLYYPAQVTACLSPTTIDPLVGGRHVNNSIGSNYCVGPVSTTPVGSFSMGLFANANITPAATTWIFYVTAIGAAPPAGTGQQSFQSSGITIAGASQDVGATLSALAPKLLNSGGGGITSVAVLPATCTPGTTLPVQLSVPPFGIFYCSALNTWSTGSADTGVIDPTSYGAKFDGKACFGNVNTITTNGTTVTCNVAAFCNGTTVACAVGQASDVNKQFTATNGCCGVNLNFQGVSLLTSPSTPTTIVSVTNATTIVISQSAGVNAGAALIIAWATNDDAAITAAETAWQSGNKCRTFQLPAGITATLQPHWTNPGASCNAAEPQADYTAQVQGQGIGSTIIGIFPGFNWTGCTANGNTCFGGYLEQSWMNFQFNGFGWGNTGTGSTKNLVGIGLGGQVSQVACSSAGGSDTNLTGLQTGLGVRVWGIAWDGCGGGSATSPGWNVGGGITKAYYSFVGDTLGTNVFIQAGNDLTDYGGDYGITGGTTIMRVDGRYHGIGSNLFGCGATNSTAINQSNGATSVVILDGARWNCASTTSNGVFMNGAAQKLYLVGGTHVGGTTSAVNNTAGTAYISGDTTLDAGLLTGAAAGVFIADGHSVEGFCTGVGTAASTLALRVSGTSTTGTGIPTTCTSTTIDAGIPIAAPRTALRLNVSATAAGTNASSGVVTVLKNGAGTTLTCTIGTGTTCIDTTHSVAFVNGDLISIQFTTQGADTLAGVKAQVLWQ